MERESFRWRPRQMWSMVQAAAKDWRHDHALSHAAALAYYALFAVGPLLLITIGIAGLLVGDQAARSALLGQVASLGGQDVADAVGALLASIGPSGSTLSIAVGVFGLLLGAAAVFRHLRDSMNVMWEVELRKGVDLQDKLKRFARKNFIGFFGVLGLGLLFVLALMASAYLQSAPLVERLPYSMVLWRLVQYGILFIVSSLAFAGLFRWMPDADIAWSDVVVGAMTTGLLFVIGQAMISIYLANFATTGGYGAAGSFVALLVWVYYSGVILYFGAELTQVYANRYGHHVEPNEFGRPAGVRARPSKAAAGS